MPAANTESEAGSGAVVKTKLAVLSVKPVFVAPLIARPEVMLSDETGVTNDWMQLSVFAMPDDEQLAAEAFCRMLATSSGLPLALLKKLFVIPAVLTPVVLRA